MSFTPYRDQLVADIKAVEARLVKPAQPTVKQWAWRSNKCFGNSPRLLVRSLIRLIAWVHGYDPKHLTGHRRSTDVVMARWHAINLAHRERPDLTIVQLGRIFDRDHSAIIYALKEFPARAHLIRHEIDEVERLLRAAP